MLLFLSHLFSVRWSILLNFFQKILQYFSLRNRLFFCKAPVSQLGEVSWSVVCAACCHMALVFAVMHLYNNFFFIIASVHAFLFILFFSLFFKSRIDKSTEWSMIPACPSLMCFCFFLTKAIPKGLILRKFCV